jgi:TatD DNase family protein
LNTPAPKTVLTYRVKNNLYINLTNRCNASCWFCDRKGEAFYFGKSLKMKKIEEPPASVFIKKIGDPLKYDEIVFCGFGEPTIRLKEMIEIAQYVKSCGGQTRLNTNGHGNYINKRNIVPEIAGCIDRVSISMNSEDRAEYVKIMRVKPELYDSMLEFAKQCLKHHIELEISIVTLSTTNTKRLKEFVNKKLKGATLKFRNLIDFGDQNLREKIIRTEKIVPVESSPKTKYITKN